MQKIMALRTAADDAPVPPCGLCGARVGEGEHLAHVKDFHLRAGLLTCARPTSFMERIEATAAVVRGLVFPAPGLDPDAAGAVRGRI